MNNSILNYRTHLIRTEGVNISTCKTCKGAGAELEERSCQERMAEKGVILLVEFKKLQEVCEFSKIVYLSKYRPTVHSYRFTWGLLLDSTHLGKSTIIIWTDPGTDYFFVSILNETYTSSGSIKESASLGLFNCQEDIINLRTVLLKGC